MKPVRLAAVLVLGAASAAVSAEGLEETYAKLCGNGQKNETCNTLRKGLLEKLTRESGGGAEAATPTVARTAIPTEISSLWGEWAVLAGTYWEGKDGSLIRYRWQEPGRILIEEIISLARTSERRLTLAPDGQSLQWENNGRSTALSVLPSGEFTWLIPNIPNARTAYRLEPEAIPMQYQNLQDGVWKVHHLSETVFKRLDERVFRQRLADMEAFKQRAADPTEIAKRWGIYGQLAGHTWVAKIFSGFRQIKSFRWIEPGFALEMVTEQPDSPNKLRLPSTLSLNSDTRTIALAQGPLKRTIEADGSIREETDLGNGEIIVTRLAMSEPGSFEETLGTVKKGKYKTISRERYRRLDILEAKKSSGPGLLGTLVGAGVGADAAGAAGLDTGQAVGAIMKGASVTSTGAVASALGSTGDQLLSGGGAASALGAVGGTSGGASYPTKPNLAISACSGFSEANYRTKALEGGGDSQLNVMCGQAFEYYTMYKRAIAQGYSEADANRTYAAHEQSARVASGYLSSHGAN